MKTTRNDIAIKLTDVSKRFKLYHNPITGPVKEILLLEQKAVLRRSSWR